MLTNILYRFTTFKAKKAKFGKHSLKIYIADSFAKQIVGLMYRRSIGKYEGMLFSFADEGHQGIWMLNMNFAIDVVWADQKGKVVDIASNVQPCKGIIGCETHTPKRRAKYVLEVNSGMAQALGIQVGSSIRKLIW